tara:strand:+ start:591 stop:788 length:198 start_codon:yes stop_codon:yes gene_type:complete
MANNETGMCNSAKPIATSLSSGANIASEGPTIKISIVAGSNITKYLRNRNIPSDFKINGKNENER